MAGKVKAEYKELVRASGVRMIDSGLSVATWGNISACDREEGLMYITPSGMNYHTLTDDDIVVFDLDGNHVEGDRRPSIELQLHRGMFNARPETTACIHTHPIFSTVFSSMGRDIPIDLHDEAAQALGGPVRCATYQLPGTQDLADAAIEAIGKDSNACLLRSHGAVCIGGDMDSAFKVATVLEMVSEIYWRILATGNEYQPISAENVAAMQEFVKTKYGQY